MSDFEWRKEYELGIPALDDSHRQLVELAGQVAKRMHAQAPKDQLAQSVRALADFTALHFAQEEQLMERSQYPENRVHAEHHGELLDELKRFSDRLLSIHSRDESVKTLAFLRDWVANHILYADRKLAAHLSQT